jgi:hypothetical protein
MFGNNAVCKIWSVVDKGKWSEVSLTSSSKSYDGKFQTDFSSKYVRFVGKAHQKRPRPENDILITSCGVTNIYFKDGVKCYNKNPVFTVFDFDFAELPHKSTTSDNVAPVEFEDIAIGGDLPF